MDRRQAEQKDIFETDFDVPSLEESGSQAVALDESDTDLESSDFDLALEEGEPDGESMDDSGSQVVVLGEEDEDAAPEAEETHAQASPPSARPTATAPTC